ncbi:MAG: lytic transglycosylase domain-containing protein [Vulcanimicrobiota bacterium]
MRFARKQLAWFALALLPALAFAENSYSNAPTRIPTHYKTPPKKWVPVYLYSYNESAFQDLPQRTIWAPQLDPYTKEVVQAPISLSQLITDNARSNDIDPLIVDILTRHESGFDTEAVSPVGARGLMQLMPDTAASMGVTDIHDPVQNVSAGTRYLTAQYRRYGELQLALAAYNAGPTTVDNYGGIPPYAETQNYVASITSEYVRNRRRRSR